MLAAIISDCLKWLIGSYFFKIEDGSTIMLNGDTYRTIINDIFVPAVLDTDVNDVWYQHDAATYHISYVPIDLLP